MTRGPEARKAPVNPNVEMEKIVRSAVEANAAQLKRFDANQDGKLDDAEWANARREIQKWSTPTGSEPKPLSATPSPAEEQKRLERVAAEVERRRKVREQAMQQINPK